MTLPVTTSDRFLSPPASRFRSHQPLFLAPAGPLVFCSRRPLVFPPAAVLHRGSQLGFFPTWFAPLSSGPLTPPATPAPAHSASRSRHGLPRQLTAALHRASRLASAHPGLPPSTWAGITPEGSRRRTRKWSKRPCRFRARHFT